jgi:hypothetical protein
MTDKPSALLMQTTTAREARQMNKKYNPAIVAPPPAGRAFF